MPPVDHVFLNRGLAATTPHPLGLEVSHAQGPWIHLTDETKLFDAVSGIGVTNFGHGNDVVLNQLRSQLEKHLHTMVYGEFLQKTQTEASALLCATLPKELDGIYFLNSGAEAIDGAIKLSRRVNGRTRVMAVSGSYHGNTIGSLSVSSNESRKAAYRPLLPEVEFLKWNDPGDLKRIDSTVACVIVETVQGDAGVRIPSKNWLQDLRAKCRETGALLVLDEIQCGMGRTGKPWAFEHFDIVPDILCMGKALGGGMAIGAMATSKARLSLFAHNPSLGHITTFGGHPMACAGAVGALKSLDKINFTQVERLNRMWQDALESHVAVRNVRRIGAFFAVEMESAEAVQKTIECGLKCARGTGVLLFYFLSVPHAFRLAPPLTCSEDEMATGLRLILQALDHVS